MLLESLPLHPVIGRSKRQELLLFRVFEPNFSFQDYNTGRVFQKSGELRWEREQDQFQVVYIGEEGIELSATIEALSRDYRLSSATLPPVYSEPKEYYLFGTRLQENELDMIGPPAQPGDFAEVRIHRLLRYPLKDEGKETQGPIRLRVKEFYDKVTGQLVLFRFVGLNEEEPKEAKKS